MSFVPTGAPVDTQLREADYKTHGGHTDTMDRLGQSEFPQKFQQA